jgi:predicted nucleic acid-binding protein
VIVVDTSAIHALLTPRDPHHGEAARILGRIASEGSELLFPNYVVSETFALLMRRFGMPATRAANTVISRGTILWTTPLEHAAATHEFLNSGRRLSFVDCATFATMRSRKLTTAFAFDEDFAAAGFDLPRT